MRKRVSRLYVVVEKRVQPEINTRHYSNGLSFAATFLPFFLTGVINKGGNISLLFSTSTGAGSVIKQRGLYLANQLSRMKACSQSYRLRSFFFFLILIFIVKWEVVNHDAQALRNHYCRSVYSFLRNAAQMLINSLLNKWNNTDLPVVRVPARCCD